MCHECNILGGSPTKRCVGHGCQYHMHRGEGIPSRGSPPPQDFNIMGLVLSSTKHRVCPHAWTYLRAKVYHPHTEAAAYSLLVALFEKGRSRNHNVW